MKEISIDQAKEVSEKSGYSVIVILGIDSETGMQHVTTYGATKSQSLEAANAGNWLKGKLGWPKSMCRALPEKNVLEGKSE